MTLTYALTMTHRPLRDGSIINERHVPFYLALETAADAWLLSMREHCAGVLEPQDVAVVHVASDFRRELFTGAVEVEVALHRIGRSSITFLMEVVQAGRRAATITFVVARVDPSRVHSMAVSTDERAALQTIPTA